MCGGVEYPVTDEQTNHTMTHRIFFPRPYAQIPVLTDDGPMLVQWGKRKGEDEALDIPQTGWARLESLVNHQWDKYTPSRVRIAVKRWMEKDPEKTSHWFAMNPDTYLLGVQLQTPEKSVVYVVTHAADADFAHIHPRQPMVVTRTHKKREDCKVTAPN